jgi:hypothetical protein
MKVVLEYTSYWLFLPALLAPSKLLSLFVIATAIVSAWSWHNPTSQRVEIDRLFARVLFILLLSTYRKWYFVAGTVATYLFSIIAMNTQQSSICQTLFHLLFRYVGFWWVYMALIGAPSSRMFLTLSGTYWLSSVILLELSKNSESLEFNT